MKISEQSEEEVWTAKMYEMIKRHIENRTNLLSQIVTNIEKLDARVRNLEILADTKPEQRLQNSVRRALERATNGTPQEKNSRT